MKTTTIAILTLIICLSSCTYKAANEDNVIAEVKVFVAASLTGVITELADSFSVKHNTKVILNAASSGTLARQIEQGEIPDVYISANSEWAVYVSDIIDSSFAKPITIQKNCLVLIAPVESGTTHLIIDSNTNLLKLLHEDKLAMGNPKHVPAGKYAQQSLEYYNLYKSVSSSILPCKDARSTLMTVEIGEASLGIVYKTDAFKSGKVKILGTIGEHTHSPIEYSAVKCRNNNNSAAFMKYITSQYSDSIWAKHGFDI